MLRAVDVLFTRVYHRLDVLSPCKLPETGPAILVCNHISGLDPAMIQSVCPRLIVWMMASEYYTLKGLGWLYRQLHAIPVDRSGRDVAATRQALRALHDGHVLGIFPEGKIETSRNLLPFQTGVAMMAIKTGVRVYPACIDGTQRNKRMVNAYLQPQSARIAFGAPINLSGVTGRNADLESATQTIRGGVQYLWQALDAARLGHRCKILSTDRQNRL